MAWSAGEVVTLGSPSVETASASHTGPLQVRQGRTFQPLSSRAKRVCDRLSRLNYRTKTLAS